MKITEIKKAFDFASALKPGDWFKYSGQLCVCINTVQGFSFITNTVIRLNLTDKVTIIPEDEVEIIVGKKYTKE